MKGVIREMGEQMTLGRFISGKRRMLHMTQEELAGKIYVSKSAVAKWETDGGIPDRDNLKRLSTVINVSVDEMYRIIGSKNREDKNPNINITSEVIMILESYGYKVLRPGEEEC